MRLLRKSEGVEMAIEAALNRETGGSLTVAERLAEALNGRGVPYCHWKSNVNLAEAMGGQTDLDILVERKYLAQALTILLDLGFKEAVVKRRAATPGIYHYYGLDSTTGQLVHVHLFSNIITGESYVKTHWLPFDHMLLESTVKHGIVQIPSKPAELALFICRILIKYGSLPDLLHLLRRPADVRDELTWLKAETHLGDAFVLLRKYCPVIDEALFVECIRAFDEDSSLVKKLVLAQRIRRRLRIYTKYSVLMRMFTYMNILCSRIWRRVKGYQKDKVLHVGGAVIAFVGPEATGKSTLVSDCSQWLGGVFAVKRVHAGKPPPSWLTLPFHRSLPLLRRFLPGYRSSYRLTRASRPSAEGPPQAERASLIQAVRAITLAWDRRRLLVRARRSAAHGDIVICDRYPSGNVGAMDSARLRPVTTASGLGVSIYNWLARLENRLYEEIPPPDVVLRLHVSLETARRRNRDRIKKEGDAYLISRHKQNKEWHKAGVKYVYDIDTETSLTETSLDIRRRIWGTL